MKHVRLYLLAAAGLMLSGCGQTLDFRNAEVSNSKIYEEGQNEPFSGRVTNVPLGVAPVPKIGSLLKLVGQFTGDNSVEGLLMGAFVLGLTDASSDSPVVCNVKVDDGLLNGDAECTLNKTGATIYKFKYADSIPTGMVKLYSAKHEGKLLAEMNLDDKGVLQGKSEIFHSENGKKVYVGTWVDGEPDGEIRRYNHENGNLIANASFKAGKFDGELVEYTPDGTTLIRKSNWVGGALQGPFEEYDETGKQIKVTTYIDNVDQQILADAQRSAKELIAAGYGSENDSSLPERLFAQLECVDNHSRSNEYKGVSRAELEKGCNLVTVETFAAERAAEVEELNRYAKEEARSMVEQGGIAADQGCVDAWTAAHRAEAGEESAVSVEQIREWQQWCAEGKEV